MHSKHPDIARRWDKEYPTSDKLPDKKRRPRFRSKAEVEAHLESML